MHGLKTLISDILIKLDIDSDRVSSTDVDIPSFLSSCFLY